MSKKLVGKSIPALLLGLLLTGCGGGGGSTAATTNPPASNSISLSGTAAVGFPIVGATVSVTCAAGPAITGIANTSATGAWSTTASGQTLPCVVSVTGGTTNNVNNTTTYQSIANGAGIVNVTPLTSLVVANLIGSSTATPTSAQLATITQAQINTSIANVQTALGATLPSTINPITTTFTPTGGVVMDDVLTAMANAMTSSGTTYAALLSSSASAAPGAAITPPAGYSAALVTAYAGTTSGSTGTGGGGTLPVAPTVGTPVVVGSANINLSWPAVSGATSYNIYRSTSPSVSITPANRVATSYVSIVFMDTGLSAATTYYYKVTAINAAGEGAGSVEVSAITNAAAGADTSAPTGLTATVASDTQVNLSWNAVPGATQYIVSRSTTPGMAALLASNAVSMTAATSANITGLSAATTYYFAVQSTTPGSVASAEVSAKTGAILGAASVTTLAVTDAGTGAVAGFSSPTDIAVDTAGNLYVADHHFLQQVLKITPAGLVSKLPGIVDGGVQSGIGITVDDAGNLYVTNGTLINKVTPAGVVSTLAGSGVSGNSDGTGAAASFNGLYGITVDSLGNAYVADRSNHTIRKIDASGVVTTLAGSAGVWGNADGPGTSARFRSPNGVALDSIGNLYVTDGGNNTIRKITPAGVVSTLAGGTFWVPHGICIDSAGNLYVTDSGPGTPRVSKITPNGVVSTLAGSAGVGNVGGTGATAKFNLLNGITVDSAGNLYVVDRNNNAIRKIQQ